MGYEGAGDQSWSHHPYSFKRSNEGRPLRFPLDKPLHFSTYVHSQNPVGAKIEGLMDNFNDYLDDLRL